MKRILSTTGLIVFMIASLSLTAQNKKTKKDNHTIIMIDGIDMPFNFNIESINTDKIKSTFVIKNPDKAKKYGSNNVIIVNTKKDSTTKDKPIIIVDNVKMNKEFSLNSILPSFIESVSILKGKAATDAYGDKAKNGAILITLKKKVDNKDEDCHNILAYSYESKLKGNDFLIEIPIEVNTHVNSIKVTINCTVTKGSFSIQITNPEGKDIIGKTKIEDGGMNISKTLNFNKKSPVGKWIVTLKSEHAEGKYSIHFNDL